MIGEISSSKGYFSSSSSVSLSVVGRLLHYLFSRESQSSRWTLKLLRKGKCLYLHTFSCAARCAERTSKNKFTACNLQRNWFHKIGTKRFSSCNPLCFFGPRSPPNCFLSIYLSVSIWRLLDVCPKFMCLIRMNIKIITRHARVAAGERFSEKSLKWHKLVIASELPSRDSSGGEIHCR